MERGDFDGASDDWCVIADSSQVGSRLPLTMERFGETLVLWRDPEGVIRGAVVRPDDGLNECPSTDEIVVRLIQGEVLVRPPLPVTDRGAWSPPGASTS